jgi:hypothetical protein
MQYVHLKLHRSVIEMRRSRNGRPRRSRADTCGIAKGVAVITSLPIKGADYGKTKTAGATKDCFSIQ